MLAELESFAEHGDLMERLKYNEGVGEWAFIVREWIVSAEWNLLVLVG
jgi:hypothetical protein